MADPAFLLGAAVVKTACKIWLKDNAIAADAAVELMDIVKAKVSDAREQRRVRNLFEDMGDRVADNVLRNMAAEFRGLADNEREAAVLAVADTLDKAKLTNKQLFAADLNTDKLTRSVRTTRFTRDLDQGATALYDRVLWDCCAHVIELANVLPGFEVGVFGELLSRQRELVRHLDQSFDRLSMQLGGAAAETFEPAFLRLVANQLDKVELFGVTVSDRIESYPLSVAYVSLSISSKARFDDAGLFELPEKSRRRITSIEDALGDTRRAFIRGEAGSGKTTLLQWLAVRCGRREFDGPLRGWNDCVPLLIRLRRYSGKELPDPEEFVRDVGGPIADTMPMGWVHDLLRAGRALVLVDGVDELPEQQRRRARTWLRHLLLSYPDARFVVTSRPAAAAEDWLDGEAFDALEIQPMTLADLDAFVDHWHAAMVEGFTHAVDRERIELSRSELARTIRTHRHLRMLAVSPLMTALICALHLDRRMQLPQDRMELYAIALEMLIERRDTEREIGNSAVAINRNDKMVILGDLAYWLVRNGLSSAPRNRVIERLAVKLRNLHRVNGTADDVLQYLLNRSGLLREPVDGQIDFVHKTFQEYLAGWAAVEEADIDALVTNAQDDQWREVVRMAVGHARARQTDELLRKILRRASNESEWRYVLEALAVGCIQQAPELSPDLRKQLEDVASNLLPPKGMKQALALASAGDLALELLPVPEAYSLDEAAATVRLAATIGGDQALQVIGDLAASIDDRLVQDEVEWAWLKFDPERFAEEVMARTSSRILRIEDPSLLVGLSCMSNLTHLECHFAHGYGDVGYIDGQPGLQHLNVFDPRLRAIEPVGDHPGLKSLYLRGDSDGLDLSPIMRSGSLEKVELMYSIDDPEQLAMLYFIKQIGFTEVVDMNTVLPFIADGNPLERINIWQAVLVTALDGLVESSRLADLDFLLVKGAEQLRSIAGIDRWASTMTGVYLHAENLQDVELVANLPHLEFANLANTPIRSLDFTVALPNLRRLHIGMDGAAVPDLAPLCELPALADVHIWGDQTVDVSRLAGAMDLTVHIVGGERAVSGLGWLPDSVTVDWE